METTQWIGGPRTIGAWRLRLPTRKVCRLGTGILLATFGWLTPLGRAPFNTRALFFAWTQQYLGSFMKTKTKLQNENKNQTAGRNGMLGVSLKHWAIMAICLVFFFY